ncbi:hypothetical protein [Rhodococcus olei]|uniref:hypothetical protein n=1 Tax=Rhodococcus olei TaxID=2161675 RepID=UPI0031E99D9A
MLIQLVFLLMGAELFVASPLLPPIAGDFGTSIAATAWVVTAFLGWLTRGDPWPTMSPA